MTQRKGETLEEFRVRRRICGQSPKRKASKKVYRDKLENKIQHSKYMKLYRAQQSKEQRLRQKERQTTPEYKIKQKKRREEPERKAKYVAYQKSPKVRDYR